MDIMRSATKQGLVIFIVLTGLFLCSLGTASERHLLPGEYRKGEVLVVLKSAATPLFAAGKDMQTFEAELLRSAEILASSAGAGVLRAYGALAASSGKSILLLESERKSTEELVHELEKHPEVLGVSPNYLSRALQIPDDPYFTDDTLWGMNAISAPGAWDISVGTSEIFVAVLDTGIDYTHPDLRKNMGRDLENRYGINTSASPVITEDPRDDDGHGTHVAGTIGARGNNGIGVTGVNWRVSLLGVKVLDERGYGSDSAIIEGLNYVLEQKRRGLNIRVINMSIGGWRPPVQHPEENPYALALKAISDADILIAVASGNEGQNLDNPGGPGSDPLDPEADYRGMLAYPACYDIPNMVTVGSIDDLDRDNSTEEENYELSNFSNHSPRYVDIAAPGAAIISTIPQGAVEYGWKWGTSMACPHVAGAAALLAAAYPEEKAWQLKERLLHYAAENPNLAGKIATRGHLEINRALRGTSPSRRSGGGGCLAGKLSGSSCMLILLPLLLLAWKRI